MTKELRAHLIRSSFTPGSLDRPVVLLDEVLEIIEKLDNSYVDACEERDMNKAALADAHEAEIQINDNLSRCLVALQLVDLARHTDASEDWQNVTEAMDGLSY